MNAMPSLWNVSGSGAKSLRKLPPQDHAAATLHEVERRSKHRFVSAIDDRLGSQLVDPRQLRQDVIFAPMSCADLT